jgi:hypothetical protein
VPEFLHKHPDLKDLFEQIADEKSLLPAVVEKDYWIMHCLWGLQQSGLRFEMKGGTSLSKGWQVIDRFSEDIDIAFDVPEKLSLKGKKAAQVTARKDYFDGLAQKIRIPDIDVERNAALDDEEVKNGAISLRYGSLFAAAAGLRQEVLLEVGFEATAPNEGRNFTSWALDRARTVGIPHLTDNRALGVICFNPEYTFVDKLQTICRKFRQYRDRDSKDGERPRQFLRHYYDLYRMLEVERVQKFIGTEDYLVYREKKLKVADAAEFESKKAFKLSPELYEEFEKEYPEMNAILIPPYPSFKEIFERIREQAPNF